MKKVYIKEESINVLNKQRLLPKFLFKAVKNHATSLGDNEAFPNGGEYPFDYTVLKKRYNEVCDSIESLNLENLEEDYLMSLLSKLIKECKDLEKPIRHELERICENALNRLFAIPKEIVNMKFRLVDKVTFKGAVRVTPENDEEVKYSFKDINDIEHSNKVVEKRRFINALIQGAAYTYARNEELYADDINAINSSLLPLYEQINIINDYLLFTKKEELSDDKPMQGSYAETHIGMQEEKSSIEVQGIIFPLLFQESIKGLFDLFSAHGLPSDKRKAQYIIKKADYILAEPWDMRLGVGIWNQLFGDIEDTNAVPYVFVEYIKLPTDEFNVSTKEILSNTERGNEILSSMIDKATYDSDYEAFQNRINAKNVNKAVINDSYFTASELDGFNLDGEEDGDVIEEDDIDEGGVYQSFGVSNEGVETWYRGICGSFNEELNQRQIWLADTPEYAASYAGECEEDGHLYAFDIDMSKFNEYDWWEDEYFEPIDGFSEGEQKELMEQGYNGYTFALDEGTVLVLFDPSLIVNVRELPLNEYLEESNKKDTDLITESQESKSIAAAKKLVMQRLNYNDQQADEFIRIKLRNDLPALRTPQGGKFILGVTRMFCDGELRSANDIGNLNSTLKLIASNAHINEYDRNLNNLSYQELVQRFAKAMSDNLEAEKAEVGQMTFDTPSDYEIVRIDSFEQASEYGGYTTWCVTHDKDMFNSYTSDGINQFYFCLKNGFESVDRQPSEGCPLDEYGLSMIAVSVNENGMLNTCTCRWNHDNGGDDSIMDAKQVSKLIGMNFFEVFKPNNKWKELVANATQRLANGEDPSNVFDSCEGFHEGLAVVILNNKYNFINQEGKFLSNQWFDWCESFREGFAAIELNDKCNFINQEGKFLSNQWFDRCWNFYKGFAWVELNNKYNFINQEGKFLSNQWFDGCGDFCEGFASVRLNDECNFINQEGKFLSNKWFDGCENFNNGFAKVEFDDKYNFINQEGKVISDQWYNYCDDFYEGFAAIELNDKCNFINQEGKFLSNQWFDRCWNFNNGFAKVRLNYEWNFINQEGKIISNRWFDNCWDFNNGFAVVKVNGKYNFVNQEGKILSNQWFDGCSDFRNGFANVELNGKKYYIDTNGNLTLKESKDKGKTILVSENQLRLFKEESDSNFNEILLNSTVDSIDFIESNVGNYGEEVMLSVDGIEIPRELVSLDFRPIEKRFPKGKQQILNIDIELEPSLRGQGLGTKIYAKAVREFGAICSRHSTRHNDDGISGIFNNLNSFDDIMVFQDTYDNLENETICDYYAILNSQLDIYI